MDYNKRPVLGLTEKVVVIGNNGTKKEIVARIDSGATKSAIHRDIVKELKLGPVYGKKLVKSTNGQSVRPLMKVKVEVLGKTFYVEFTVANRDHLRYKVLIGQNILKPGRFIIDPSRKK